jgi:hypothetical protein
MIALKDCVACSYLRGVLCSAAVLEAAGVSNAEATELSAALTWAMKDGFSMIGGLVYSYRYCAAHYFDSYVKEFRLFADVINDIGFTLDMLYPCFRIICSLSRAWQFFAKHCGISAGATKSNIREHLCNRRQHGGSFVQTERSTRSI